MARFIGGFWNTLCEEYVIDGGREGSEYLAWLLYLPTLMECKPSNFQGQNSTQQTYQGEHDLSTAGGRNMSTPSIRFQRRRKEKPNTRNS